MHDHKVLNCKPNKTGINNCHCRNKDTCPLPNSYQTKCIIYQANNDCQYRIDNINIDCQQTNIDGHKQKCYLGS